MKDLGYYFAVVENNLSRDVEAGENDGEQLRHDYVVRELLGPYSQSGFRVAEKKSKYRGFC